MRFKSLAALSVLAISSVSATPVFAQNADMATANWAGTYTGVTLGYGFGGDNDVKTSGQAAANVTNVAGGARPASVSLDPDGFTGGVNIGYNWQYDRVVMGLETDISYTDFEDSKRVVTTALNGVDRLNNDFSQSLDYLGTVRGRVGYTFDRSLFYATGGLAYGRIDNNVNMYGPAGQLQFTDSSTSTEIGYTVGGGMEYQLQNNWNVGANYLYYDLGDDTAKVNVVAGGGGGGTGYDSEFENSGHVARLALTYRWN